jgi:hypothetical protein
LEEAMRGIIFSATGSRYIETAIEAAKRSARFNPVSHTVFCSAPRSSPGLETIVFETCGNPYIDKISNILSSPYEETIYLDVDCYAVERFTELFDLLSWYDLAASHAPGYRGSPDPEVPQSFYEINTGVLVFRRNQRVLDLCGEWRSTYSHWLLEPPFEGADGKVLGQDQPAFRRCLWRAGIPIYVLAPEYNWRFLQPSFLCGKAKIVHGFVSNVDLLAARINGATNARVFPALSKGGIDFPIDGAEISAALGASFGANGKLETDGLEVGKPPR